MEASVSEDQAEFRKWVKATICEEVIRTGIQVLAGELVRWLEVRREDRKEECHERWSAAIDRQG